MKNHDTIHSETNSQYSRRSTTQRDKTDVNKKLDTVSTEVNELSTKYYELKEELMNVQDSCELLVNENSALKTVLENVSNDFENCIKENVELNKRLDKQEEGINQVRQENSELKNQISSFVNLNEEIKRLTTRLDEQQKSIEQIKDENLELKNQIKLSASQENKEEVCTDRTTDSKTKLINGNGVFGKSGGNKRSEPTKTCCLNN